MKILLIIFLFFATYVDCSAKDRDSLYIYYSINDSFVNIIDSISNVDKKSNIKNDFQKQDFYVFFICKSGDLFMYITHCLLLEDEFGSKYAPFGCVIKNDSFFYLVKNDESRLPIDTLFRKTNNQIIPSFASSQNFVESDNDSVPPIFMVFRQSKMFKYTNGNFTAM